MTIVENVSSDFGWFPLFLENLASNPVFGLFLGASVALLIWKSQTRLAFSQKLHEEKRLLYKDMVSALELADSLPRRQCDETDILDRPELIEINRLYGQVRLIAPEQVIQAAARVIVAVNERILSEENFVESSDGKRRTHFLEIRHQLEKLIEDMRNDLKMDH